MRRATALPMPFAGREVPHVVIEVNQKCNIKCVACYKSKSSYSKPLAQILDEIDLAASKRRLSCITLAGGEPTLHPDLPRVIAHIREMGITPQLCTNGSTLSYEKLRQFGAAGLEELYLHIDSRQTRADVPVGASEIDLNPLRAKIAKRAVAHGFTVSLAVTLYRETLPELMDLVDLVINNRDITGLFATCFKDVGAVVRAYGGGEILGSTYEPLNVPVRETHAGSTSDNPSDEVTVADVEAELARKARMEPFGTIASNRSTGDRRWVFFAAYVIEQPDGRRSVLHAGPEYGRLIQGLQARQRRRGERYSFATVIRGAEAAAACALSAAISIDPVKMARTSAFLLNLLKPGSEILYKTFTFQQGPNVDNAGRLVYCKDCPDATIRDGVLVPVCLADQLIPTGEGGQNRGASRFVVNEAR